ncbi:hypothetical protein L7F22_001121 [Adiantum nelumboides]|nr:hypothetical protein [Adiantum nelumboides]
MDRREPLLHPRAGVNKNPPRNVDFGNGVGKASTKCEVAMLEDAITLLRRHGQRLHAALTSSQLSECQMIWISCKEINPTTIARARKDAIETVCALEEHFPTSILNIQVHLLVHLVDEVEIAGTVHAQWMFFLERFMKTLKGFVRQRARPKGSMAEGWMVQESCVFISEYLTRSQNNIIELWNIKDDERVVSEVPQGNGVVKRFSEAEQTKVSDYCMMNTDIMQRWYEMYEQMRQQQIRAPEE